MASSLTPAVIVESMEACGFTHVIWIPDSHLGRWESSLEQSRSLRLIRPTREGEAVGIAGGLLLGGAKPLVVMQCTGFFEAGDAVRNIVHDLGLPLQMIVGVRSHRAAQQGTTSDNCPTFAEPLVQAWRLPYAWFDPEHDSASDLMGAFRTLQRGGAGVLLWSE